MAEEKDDSQKTEEPTQYKLQQAEEKGDVTQSPDVAAWLVLAAATGWLLMWSPSMADSLRTFMTGFLSGAHNISLSPQTAGNFASGIGFELLQTVGVPFALLMAVAIAAHMIQHKPVFALDKIAPKLSRLSLIQGFSRVFGKQALVTFAKGLFKTAAIAAAIAMTVWPSKEDMLAMITLPVSLLLIESLSLLGQALIAALSVLGVIAIADYGWRYFERMRRLKMTREEVKDEHKQSEGDPVVKQRLRQIRLERSRKRMMAAVPKAAVIITNPTHYAVALAYESGKMGAPICVAKGVDHVALKIREIGRANNVPVVENPPLARALYASVDVDETIKPEHYKAVAQVIGFVMKLKGRVPSARTGRRT
jgi:flagellar biosynthetic protein FlhB